jgi:hypothetical protein
MPDSGHSALGARSINVKEERADQFCIDRLANTSFDIEGDFHSEERGDFRTYFSFELNGPCRIVRLDIGKVEDAA